MTTKPLRVLAPSVLVLALLAGCGQGSTQDPQPTPQAMLASAVADMYDAGTIHMEFEMRIEPASEGIALSGVQDVDLATGRSHGTMDLGMLGGTVEMIMDGETIYMSSDSFGGTGVETEWVSFDTSKMPEAAGNPFGGLGQGQSDPAAFVALFAGAVDVKDEGPDEVDGVATTRYAGTIDIGKVLAGLTEDMSRASARRVTKGLRSVGLEKIPFEAWVDEDGMLRRERIEIDFSSFPGAPEDAAMVFDATFSHFGEPLELEIPKASEVTDVTSELAGASAP